jgi:U3 small nucleolar RNA-associated protein 7
MPRHVEAVDAHPAVMEVTVPTQSLEAREEKRRLAEAQQTYGRGKKIHTKSVKDRKLRSGLKSLEQKYKDAALKARDAEILLENEAGFIEPEGELERTYKVRQDELKEGVGIEVAKKGFELKLVELGPYRADYTRNGKKLLLAGRKGHVATMDWREGKLGCELQLTETVRDAKWLHNDQFFAVAQKKHVYIYDSAGLEIHCLKKHLEPTHLEFLPYHFLLVSAVRSLRTLLTARSLRSLTSYRSFYSGNERVSEIHGHFDRPAGSGTPYPARLSNLPMPKPA